jgi:hypothetical protein
MIMSSNKSDPRSHPAKEKKTMITKEQIDAVIKAVNEGGDDDDEITEDEVIAILRDTGLDTEIPYFQELFAWERLEIAHSERAHNPSPIRQQEIEFARVPSREGRAYAGCTQGAAPQSLRNKRDGTG